MHRQKIRCAGTGGFEACRLVSKAAFREWKDDFGFTKNNLFKCFPKSLETFMLSSVTIKAAFAADEHTRDVRTQCGMMEEFILRHEL